MIGVLLLTLSTFFIILGGLGLWKHPTECRIVNSSITSIQPFYYNSYCSCTVPCHPSLPHCETMITPGLCCGLACRGQCTRIRVYTYHVNSILMDLNYHQTITVTFMYTSSHNDSKLHFPKQQPCFYLIRDMGIGNSITLFHGTDSGIDDRYLIFMIFWTIFLILCICFKLRRRSPQPLPPQPPIP
jgi:hypothetical protein